MSTSKDRGDYGELLAEEYLVSQGYTILERNWRWSRAEADIIARDEGVLVFVEVKTRTYPYLLDPEEFVTDRKILMLNELANR